MIRLGYACINLSLPGVTINRGMQKKTFLAKGSKYCMDLALANSEDLLRILQWNLANGIMVYRVSSDIVPWATEWLLSSKDLAELETSLRRAGDFATRNGMRLSFHPGPFNCPGSPSAEVVEKTLVDLECHSLVMDLLGQPSSRKAKINIHVGGSYGSKSDTLDRVVSTVSRMSSGLKSRLTLENDDTPSLYSVQDLYRVYESTGIPIVFDGHHWEVGSKSGSYEEDFLRAYSTWDVTPTFHWSNSRKKYEDQEAPPCAHSDWYYEPMLVPEDRYLDIMLESKKKDLALKKYIGDYYEGSVYSA